jgi:GNAT superfamily N-acetyltransferase
MIHVARIALVGDFDPEVTAHQAINRSLELFRTSSEDGLAAVWLGTETITPGDDSQLRAFDGIWCVPASPYKNTAGALWAIHFARTRLVPFLGTCGGFQHAVLEYARDVHGLKNADHAELKPDTATPLIHKLSCSLVDKAQPVVATGKGKFAASCGTTPTDEGFRCSFGLNPAFEHLFQSGPMEITARSVDGEVRAMELRGHPFFMGTLFQPERRALKGEVHPIVRAFFEVARDYATANPIRLRLARAADVPALEKLIPISVRALQSPYYSSAQMDAAIGPIFGVDHQLIADGTYFVAERAGEIIGCGGWSKRKSLCGSGPSGEGAETELDPRCDPARVRAFFVHPNCARRGIGRAILAACEQAILAAGFERVELLGTLAGEPLYAACDYAVAERYDLEMRDSLRLPVVLMTKQLKPA